MGLTKTEFYNAQQIKLAEVAKVLGHPARIAILQHLLKVQECICGDLVVEIGLSQPTISQHLREMKNIGLIQGSVDGTKVCYCIDMDTYNEINGFFTELFGQDLKANNSCC